MIKYITNPIHSLTQSYTAATITSLLTTNRNIAASSTRTVKHWKCTWHRKASAKTQVSLTRFLQSEVKIIHIIVLMFYYSLHYEQFNFSLSCCCFTHCCNEGYFFLFFTTTCLVISNRWPFYTILNILNCSHNSWGSKHWTNQPPFKINQASSYEKKK